MEEHLNQENTSSLKDQKADDTMIHKLFFRLLPIQVLLAGIGAVNGIVSSIFAGNFIGQESLSAIGLYAPVTQFLTAVGIMLVGGSQILCGKFMGKNQMSRTQDIFSVTMLTGALVSVLVAVLLVCAATFDLTTYLTKDEAVRDLLNTYMRGMAIGVVPLLLGQLLSSFLSLENRTKLATVASVVFIASNVVLNTLFVAVLRMGILGAALATALGLWVFFLVQASWYISGKSLLRLQIKKWNMRDMGSVIGIGVPGALSQGYQTIRRILVNTIIVSGVGSIGVSAFAASDAIFTLVWALPNGFLAVARMLMSVYIGEEDRESLTGVMRTVLFRAIPLMTAVVCLIVAFAPALTMLYERDTASEMYRLTIEGFRILPWCMPLSVFYMIFTCYAQAEGRRVVVNVMSLLDGIICVAGFSFLLVPRIGLKGVFVANILNGVVTLLCYVLYSVISLKRFPKNLEELMVIPDAFGVTKDARMDLTLYTQQDVTQVAKRVQVFCLSRGIEKRRAYYAALFLEEMAGNVVQHGFTKDNKKHTVDIRVVHREDELILRIKDDCARFDPGELELQGITDPEDIAKNIGIRMIYSLASDINYQNILGMNVLTARF